MEGDHREDRAREDRAREDRAREDRAREPSAAGPGPRRSRAGLRRLLLDAGAAGVRDGRVDAATLSYASVFSHLAAHNGVRVTYGAVHERIWDRVDDYRNDVIDHAGVLRRPEPNGHATDDLAWRRWVEAALGATAGDGSDTASGRARAELRTEYTRLDRGVGTAVGSRTASVLLTAMIDGLALRRALTSRP